MVKKILVSMISVLVMLGCSGIERKVPKEFTPVKFTPTINSEEDIRDNYIFDSNRIKKVFCEWELIDEKNIENIYMRFFNKEKNIYIDISNYAKGDTPEIAEKRFHHSSLDTNFKYLGKNEDSKKILGKTSNEYIFEGIKELAIKNTLFFDKIKMSIVVTNGDKEEYIETLNLVKEAIDTTEPIQERKCLGKLRYYTIEEMFDIEKLEKELKKYSNTGKFKNKIIGDEKAKTFISSYIYYLDEGKAVRRFLRIENNKKFSREVMNKRWERYILEDYMETDLGNPHPKYICEDKSSEKYFGVPAKVYEIRAMEKVGLIQYRYVIATDEYTIGIYVYMYDGDKKATEQDYEKLLKIVYNSLKLKMN